MTFAWPRLLELGLAAWLLASASVLGHGGEAVLRTADRVAGVAIVVVVLASIAPKLRLARLGTLAVALGLVAWGWAAFPRPGPAGAQNQILVGLVLALLVFVPTKWNRPPPSWRPYAERSS